LASLTVSIRQLQAMREAIQVLAAASKATHGASQVKQHNRSRITGLHSPSSVLALYLERPALFPL
jgi:hypothetical protein